MTKTSQAARELAKRLQEQNQNERLSWRAIAEQYPRRPDGSQIVKAGTLCRIASEADWLPRNREILIALGLVQARKPEPKHTRRIKRKIARMAAETREAVLKK